MYFCHAFCKVKKIVFERIILLCPLIIFLISATEVQRSTVTMFTPMPHAFCLLKITDYDQRSAKGLCDFDVGTGSVITLIPASVLRVFLWNKHITHQFLLYIQGPPKKCIHNLTKEKSVLYVSTKFNYTLQVEYKLQ